MTTPHLILHKVRGSPAFDIAEPFTTEDGEEMWIVSTSGHRAYPCFSQPLYEIVQEDIISNPMLPEALPDHYSANASDQRTASILAETLALLQSIGLGPKAIKRRKVE